MILSRFAQLFVAGILKRHNSLNMNSGGDHFEIGDWKHCGVIHLQGRPLTPSSALPLTQSVGLAAARADGQDGGVAPQFLLGGFAVRGALLRQAPQQVRPAGTTGIYLSNSSALHSSVCQ